MMRRLQIENNLPKCEDCIRTSRTILDTLANYRAFLAVARTGTFAAAARELGVVPSVVTKRVSQVEWLLKAPLLERTTRRVSLTAAGRQVLPALQRAIADLDGVMADVRGAAPHLQGHIRVKVPTSLGVLHLGELLHAFQYNHPLISLEVIALDRVVNPVDEGFDVVLTLLPNTFSDVAEEPLCAIARRLCASPAYLARKGAPAHPKDLVDHDTLNFIPTGNPWVFLGPTGEVKMQLQPRFTSNDVQLVCGAAIAGNGIAPLAAYLAVPEIARGALQQVLPSYPLAELWLKALVPSSRASVARVQALLSWLRQALAPSPLWTTFQ